MEVVEYNITDAAVSEMESLYMGLIISDLEDKDEFKAVHDARMVVKGKRVEVEKRRKELKSEALAWGKKVDTEAKRIKGLLEPIEAHLMDEENKVLEEQKRIQEEERARERKKIEDRVTALAEYRHMMPFLELAAMTDEEFEALLTEKKTDYETEQTRIAEEEAARKAENERLEKIRKEQEAEAARLEKIRLEDEAKRKAEGDRLAKQKTELETQAKAIQDEKDRIEREKVADRRRKEREEFERKAKEEAKIQAEKDAREKADREAKEKAAKEEAEAEEKKRQEELKPDVEKLLMFADRIREMTAGNLSVKSREARNLFDRTIQSISMIEVDFREQIEEL